MDCISVERNVNNGNQSIKEDSINQCDNSAQNISKVKGNHVVSLIYIPETDFKLVVDPTNLLIGTFDEGEIKVLNCSKEEDAYSILTYCYHDNIAFSEYSYDIAVQYVNGLMRDNLQTEIDLDDNYGIEVQKRAYDELLKLMEDANITSPNSTNTFKKISFIIYNNSL